MDVAAITVEPAGGSPGPTSAPVLAGPIRAD
jgi:anti-sigma-K factor RskA